MWILVLVVAASRLLAAPSATNAVPSSDKDSPAVSTYHNDNNRPDPFLPAKMKGKGVEARAVFDDREFHLQGILWHPTNPVAIINRKRVLLNETMTLKISSGDAIVKAVTIERDRVILNVGNRQVELKLIR